MTRFGLLRPGRSRLMLGASLGLAAPGSAPTVWLSSTASTKSTKNQRVGWGAFDPGFIPRDRTPTISGTGASHWRWQEAADMATTTSGRMTTRGRGLAPANPGNVGASDGDPWGVTPNSSYTLTLTDPGTGQTCTVTLNLTGWSYTHDGFTYTSDNAIVVASDRELRDQATGVGATRYLTRTATTAPLILVRDGVNLGAGLPAFPKIDTQCASDTGFAPGMWDEGQISDGITKHGDKSTSRRVRGFWGANYILIRPESDFGASITRVWIQGGTTVTGTKLAHFNLTPKNPAQANGPTCVAIGADYACVSDCYGDGLSTTDRPRWYVNQVVQNPLPRHGTVKNCAFIGGEQMIYLPWLEPHVAGNFAREGTDDFFQTSLDVGYVNSPVDKLNMSGHFCDNIAILSRTGTGHPDFFQHFLTYKATSQPAQGTTVWPGKMSVKRNISTLFSAQGDFNGGGDGQGGKASADYACNLYITKQGNVQTVQFQQDATVLNSTLVCDVGDPRSSITRPVTLASSGDITNLTVTGNAVHALATPYNQPTGVNVVQDNHVLPENLAAYQAAFANFPLTGFEDLLQDVYIYDEARARVVAAMTPKNVLEANGGLVRADGTIIGALKLDSSWNVPA